MSSNNSKRKGWVVFVRDIALMVFLIFAARSAFADWYEVPTGSMKPTILIGDRVFVNRVAYDLKVPFTRWHLLKWGDPKRGQIVVLHSPTDNTRLIKRVVGVPGDHIVIRDQNLILNGTAVELRPITPDELTGVEGLSRVERGNNFFALEQLPGKTHPVMYAPVPGLRISLDIEIPEGYFFVMGDNRDRSADSRVFGLVERDLIVGHARKVVVSFKEEGTLSPRWDRFFESLD